MSFLAKLFSLAASLNSRTRGTLAAAPASPSIPEPELRLLYNWITILLFILLFDVFAF